MKLIGYAFETGRIDFPREVNPWAFQMIDSGMKASQKDRIVLDPLQAPIELHSADVNDEEPSWMRSTELLLQSANQIILQYREPGFLRFRKATHDAKQNRTFITLGNQDESNLYALENWGNIRYFFALRRNIINFDITTLITHKKGQGADEKGVQRVELPARMEMVDNVPKMTFDSSGSKATPDIIDWRGTVVEGDTGRYCPDNSYINLTFAQVVRPFTFLHEDRTEFHNHSFTFSGPKMEGLLARTIRNRMRDAANPDLA
ncbi:hypothetical protein [Mariniblastus fucicola]|uniref:Uncharacterized protein n=1 Tax=Mariniblastus fucicola TaxID=980251 RepID=A0A5B9PE43_9BACT|nr:hypothetical protein [Mariniblastus fucicola]QEG22836.1 hypothetical protein MFFC18_27210 [Mariniblastus fucicola]